jgi:parallel beta helix pectate lyase-like protein
MGGNWHRDRWYPSLRVVIRGNLLEDVGGDGIVPLACDGALVEHNILKGGRMRAEDYAAGIWPWSCDNTVVQHNEVSGMKGTRDGEGYDSDYNCRGTLFQYNFSHNNDGGFMLICNNGGLRRRPAMARLA